MNPVEQFRKYAAECREMARAASHKDSKFEWNRLAERWTRCADLAAAAPPLVRRTPKYRRSDAHA